MGNIEEDNSCDKKENVLFYLSTFFKLTSYFRIPSATVNRQNRNPIPSVKPVSCSCHIGKEYRSFHLVLTVSLPNELSEDDMLIPKRTDNAILTIYGY